MDDHPQHDSEPRDTSAEGPDAEGGTRIQRFLLEHAESSEEETLSSASAPSDVVRLREVMANVRDEVDDRTWQCFWSMAVDGESAAEVAERLGMSAAAVRQAKYRVLKRLRSSIDDRE